EHAPARRCGFVEEVEILLPRAGRITPAEDAERDRPPRFDGEIAQPRMPFAHARIAGLAVHALPRDLEETGVQLSHRTHQPPHLAPLGLAARHRPSLGRLVAGRARGREAHGAGAYRVAHVVLHRLQIVLGRGTVERALAHHERSYRGVAHVTGVIDALGQPL